jgi:hypothetical protein
METRIVSESCSWGRVRARSDFPITFTDTITLAWASISPPFAISANLEDLVPELFVLGGILRVIR